MTICQGHNMLGLRIFSYKANLRQGIVIIRLDPDPGQDNINNKIYENGIQTHAREHPTDRAMLYPRFYQNTAVIKV